MTVTRRSENLVRAHSRNPDTVTSDILSAEADLAGVCGKPPHILPLVKDEPLAQGLSEEAIRRVLAGIPVSLPDACLAASSCDRALNTRDMIGHIEDGLAAIEDDGRLTDWGRKRRASIFFRQCADEVDPEFCGSVESRWQNFYLADRPQMDWDDCRMTLALFGDRLAACDWANARVFDFNAVPESISGSASHNFAESQSLSQQLLSMSANGQLTAPDSPANVHGYLLRKRKVRRVREASPFRPQLPRTDSVGANSVARKSLMTRVSCDEEGSARGRKRKAGALSSGRRALRVIPTPTDKDASFEDATITWAETGKLQSLIDSIKRSSGWHPYVWYLMARRNELCELGLKPRWIARVAGWEWEELQSDNAAMTTFLLSVFRFMSSNPPPDKTSTKRQLREYRECLARHLFTPNKGTLTSAFKQAQLDDPSTRPSVVSPPTTLTHSAPPVIADCEPPTISTTANSAHDTDYQTNLQNFPQATTEDEPPAPPPTP